MRPLPSGWRLLVSNVKSVCESGGRVAQQGLLLGVLEPDEGKLSSPVLRGVGSRKAPLLPGENRGSQDLAI